MNYKKNITSKNMIDQNSLNHYKKLEKLIGDCYEKYKGSMNDKERKICEMYLYEQGEYGIALEELEAILEDRKVTLDEASISKLDEAKKLMGISEN